MSERLHVSSGAPWEDSVGYSRAVRIGDAIYVAGTTALDESGELVGEGDAYAQAIRILEIIKAAVERAGGAMSDIVRTRMYVTDIDLAEEIGRAHGEYFGDVRPAATMVQVSRLIDKRMLVEIEAEARLGAS